ncbi:hypothetical protein Mapa_010466 [Marchantia paleacea]|nr:hypothetical protein Mapa_010466 [Marchantia paleacea]
MSDTEHPWASCLWSRGGVSDVRTLYTRRTFSLKRSIRSCRIHSSSRNMDGELWAMITEQNPKQEESSAQTERLCVNS